MNNPPQPVAVVNVTDDLQYSLMDTGAVYRNASQVVIPVTGVDLLSELRSVLSLLHVAENQAESHTAAPSEASPPEATGTTDLTWKGFEVRGYIENSKASAEVEHPEVAESITLTWGSAQGILDHQDAEPPYSVLCAKAFMAWWDRNGFPESLKAGTPGPHDQSPLPDWTLGTLVTSKSDQGVTGIVWGGVDSADSLVLLLNNGQSIPIQPEHHELLADFAIATEA